MKEASNTKNQILETALDLFSQRGYSAVSIRNICSLVGIKESSIYYHFENKKAILDELCNHFTNYSNRLVQSFNERMSEVTSVTEEEFIWVCQSYMNDYLMEEHINKFIRMLVIEQSTNLQIAELYHHMLFDKALESQRMIFEWLIRIGFLKNEDVEYMVMEYYAPIVYFFHRYLVTGPITKEIRDEVNQKVTKHIKHFLKKYKGFI